jgi:2-phosphosulfolactate phosphatase
MSTTDFALLQDGFSARFDWGPEAARRLAPEVEVLVVVDVLSFTTTVTIAAERGARIRPATDHQAAAGDGTETIAGPRGGAGPSLSPVSMLELTQGQTVVLASPNGAACSLAAIGANPQVRLLAGCLRNAAATADLAARSGATVAVVAAGERWPDDDGAQRPAVEDLIGAGAVLTLLGSDNPSPEARAAMAAFAAVAADPAAAIAGSASGRQLHHQGFGGDVDLAGLLDVTWTPVQLVDGLFGSAR